MAKRKKRASVADRLPGPKSLKSIVLAMKEKAIVAGFRRQGTHFAAS
jgi:hypothetical protein